MSQKKRTYETAMGYENEHPDIQEHKLAEKYKRLPVFTAQQLNDPIFREYLNEWLDGYNEWLYNQLPPGQR